MLFGDESLTSGGGVTAFSTPDGTEIVLVADEYQLKSVTANKFVDSWPLPIESTTSKTKCDDFPRATNVHVMPTLSNDSTSPIVYQRSAIVTDSFNGKVYQFSAFAPHKGDFVLQHSWLISALVKSDKPMATLLLMVLKDLVVLRSVMPMAKSSTFLNGLLVDWCELMPMLTLVRRCWMVSIIQKASLLTR